MWERIKEFVKWAWNVNVRDDDECETECLSNIPPHFTFIDGSSPGFGKICADRDMPGLTSGDTHYVCDYAKPELCHVLNEYFEALWFGDDE